MKKKRWMIHGYYWDGSKSWTLLIDHHGNAKRVITKR